MGTGECNAGVTLRLTSLRSRGEKMLHAAETGTSSGLMNQEACLQALPSHHNEVEVSTVVRIE